MLHPRRSGRLVRLFRHVGFAVLAFGAGSALAQSSIPSIPAPVPGTALPSMPAATPVPPPQPPAPAPSPAQTTPPPSAKNPEESTPENPALKTPPAVQAVSTPPQALPPYDPTAPGELSDNLGSTYIPVDSPVYPMALRLYSLGYLDTAFIGMRPWTRRSLLHMLNASAPAIMAGHNDQAVALLAGLQSYIAEETAPAGLARGRVYGIGTVYTRFMDISGPTLNDSYHLGQTIANDYGRPYQSGFNNVTGFSTVNEIGLFSLYVRGEYQHAPSAPGYSLALANQLSVIDTIGPFVAPNAPQATIPYGPIPTQNPFRLQEATLSLHLLGHEISGGKSDAWLGPAAGSAMAWSNNAENIYSFRINRVEPLHVPFVSRFMGPFRYDFFFGSLKGHTDLNSPYIHSEELSFAPTANVRIAFQRSIIWGGEGHEPVTLHTFLHSFFSVSDAAGSEKVSREDPGARYSVFNFSWRLPFLTHRVTLYTDSISHDDVTPISAPRRAAYRPGIYISQFPGVPKLDFRVEAASTDISTLRSIQGQFNYFEIIQKQGYTNKGIILGDWIGREAKGGQAWLTYHLSANEWIQIEYLNKKTPKDFIPGGTTQNQFMVQVVKRLRKDLELNAWLQYEGWKAPIYVPGNGLNKNTTVAFQFTWFPKLKTGPESAIPTSFSSH